MFSNQDVQVDLSRAVKLVGFRRWFVCCIAGAVLRLLRNRVNERLLRGVSSQSKKRIKGKRVKEVTCCRESCQWVKMQRRSHGHKLAMRWTLWCGLFGTSAVLCRCSKTETSDVMHHQLSAPAKSHISEYDTVQTSKYIIHVSSCRELAYAR